MRQSVCVFRRIWSLKKRRRDRSDISLPVVVKPVDGGSSVGVSIVRTKKEMSGALKKAFKESRRVMVQKYIKGKEITCGVLEDGDGKSLCPAADRDRPTRSCFFRLSREICGWREPGDHAGEDSQAQIKEIQEFAVQAHRALGCRGMSRSDFILSGGKFYILETNTIPGMTEASLLPKAAAAAGSLFPICSI